MFIFLAFSSFIVRLSDGKESRTKVQRQFFLTFGFPLNQINKHREDVAQEIGGFYVNVCKIG